MFRAVSFPICAVDVDKSSRSRRLPSGFPQTANKLVRSQWEGLDSIQGYIGREGAETGIEGPQLLVAGFGGVLQLPVISRGKGN